MNLIVLIVVAVSAVCYADPRNIPGLIYLGKVAGSLECGETAYYVSIDSAARDTADRACRERGRGAVLASVATVEQKDLMELELKNSAAFETPYWIDGAYDSDAKVFKWANNNPLPDWAPWEADHPQNDTTYGVAVFNKRFSSKWRTYQTGQVLRYLCAITKPIL